jgi:hypothetical protein
MTYGSRPPRDTPLVSCAVLARQRRRLFMCLKNAMSGEPTWTAGTAAAAFPQWPIIGGATWPQAFPAIVCAFDRAAPC